MKIYKNTLYPLEENQLTLSFSKIVYSMLDDHWRGAHPRCNYTRLNYIERGEGMMRYEDGEIMRMTEGNIYLIPGNRAFEVYCKSRMDMLHCHLNLLKYNAYDVFADWPQVIVLENRADEISQAVKAWHRGGIADGLLLKGLFYRHLYEAIQQCGMDLGAMNAHSVLVQDALRTIQNHLRITLTIEELASMLYVSPSKLQKVFRAEVGRPLGQYITDRVLFRAEERLRDPAVSVKQISDELGFKGQYFSKLFAAHYHLTPTRYRRELEKYDYENAYDAAHKE